MTLILISIFSKYIKSYILTFIDGVCTIKQSFNSLLPFNDRENDNLNIYLNLKHNGTNKVSLLLLSTVAH